MTTSDRHSFLSADAQGVEGSVPAAGALPGRLAGLLAGVQDRLAARARSIRGRAVFVSGKVVLVDPLALLKERTVEPGDAIFADAVLRAGENSRALVLLEDGSELWLAENSELDLSDWSASASVRALRLRAGRAMVFVARQAKRFVVQLRHGVQVEALGTAFDVDAMHDRSISVDVIHGQVVLRNLEGEIAGKMGDRLSTLAGAAPKKTRGGLDASSRWMRESMALMAPETLADPSWTPRGPLWKNYRKVADPVGHALARVRLAAIRVLLPIAVFGALVWTVIHGVDVLVLRPAFTPAEMLAAVEQLKAEQREKHGPAAQALERENEIGFVAEGPAGDLRWTALSPEALRDIQNAAIPEEFKQSLFENARRGRAERIRPTEQNVVEIDGVRFDFRADAEATSDLVRWLASNGFSEREARLRGEQGLRQSVRERLPESMRAEARIPILFMDTPEEER